MNTKTKLSWKEQIRALSKRWFLDAMNAMGFGLLASLVVGLILSQINQIPFLGFLKPF